MKTELRHGLPPIQRHMAHLPLDDRGYPIPWFVHWVDGKPSFPTMDAPKLVKAVKERRCWVCGERLGSTLVFVIGPMCAVNLISSEPPSHHECATFSAKACPFLSIPTAQRNEAKYPKGYREMAGEAIKRNPGVTLLWSTRTYRPFKLGDGVLFEIGKQEKVEWYCRGRPATRQEVRDSIESGLPALREKCTSNADFLALDSRTREALLLLPQEAA